MQTTIQLLMLSVVFQVVCLGLLVMIKLHVYICHTQLSLQPVQILADIALRRACVTSTEPASCTQGMI